MRRTNDTLTLMDCSGTPVTMRVWGNAKITSVFMEASVAGLTASLNISLDEGDVDALWEQLTRLRSLRGL